MLTQAAEAKPGDDGRLWCNRFMLNYEHAKLGMQNKFHNDD